MNDMKYSWMPKFHHIHFNFETDQSFYVMEKLQISERAPWIQGDLHTNYDVKRVFEKISKVDSLKPIKSEIKCVLKDVLKMTHKFVGLRFDAHAENWMERTDELVLTDPLMIQWKWKNSKKLLKPYQKFLQDFAKTQKNISYEGEWA